MFECGWLAQHMGSWMHCPWENPYPSLRHVFCMIWCLNSAFFLPSTIIENHPTSSSTASSIYHTRVPIKIEVPCLKELIPDLSNPLFSNSPSKRHPQLQLLCLLWLFLNQTSTFPWTILWLDAALVNKLVPCVWRSSGALDWPISRLLLRVQCLMSKDIT